MQWSGADEDEGSSALEDYELPETMERTQTQAEPVCFARLCDSSNLKG